MRGTRAFLRCSGALKNAKAAQGHASPSPFSVYSSWTSLQFKGDEKFRDRRGRTDGSFSIRRPVARRTSGERCWANRLPLFLRPSSNRSDGNIVAQPPGQLCSRAKDSAEFLRKKRPPIRPVASRATQTLRRC